MISKYGIAIEHMKQKEQYHSFSACVDAGYDIKESITDIPRDIQHSCLNQQIILQSPRVLEQYNSTYILTYIVVQYRLYTGAIFHFKLVKH